MRGKAVASAGKRITLVISNDDVDDVIRIIKSIENPRLLIDGVSDSVKKWGGGFLGMLLKTLGSSMLGNKGVMRAKSR